MKNINWEQLYLKNASLLKGICRRYVGCAEVANDLVHETFITAIERIDTYRGSGSIEGWIRKIAVNKALLYLREKHRIGEQVEELANILDVENEMESLNNKRAVIENTSFSTDDLLAIIDSLPVHHKSVFNLYVIDGYSHKQIANMMSISTNTSKSHLLRARNKAQEMLYEKALLLSPSEKRRRTPWWLLLFYPNYTDQIFQRSFKGFVLNSAAVPAAIKGASIATVKASLALNIIVGSGIVASVGLGGFFVANKLQTKIPKVNAPVEMPLSQPDTISRAIAINPEAQNFANADTVNAIPEKSKKVIVKKKIVIRDTIRLEKPISE